MPRCAYECASIFHFFSFIGIMTYIIDVGILQQSFQGKTGSSFIIKAQVPDSSNLTGNIQNRLGFILADLTKISFLQEHQIRNLLLSNVQIYASYLNICLNFITFHYDASCYPISFLQITPISIIRNRKLRKHFSFLSHFNNFSTNSFSTRNN